MKYFIHTQSCLSVYVCVRMKGKCVGVWAWLWSATAAKSSTYGLINSCNELVVGPWLIPDSDSGIASSHLPHINCRH